MRFRREFNHCQKFGKRAAGRWLVISVIASAEKTSRLGLAVSRKAGNAVVRNRLKRRLRESFRRGLAGAGLPPVDVCVSARPGAGAAPAGELSAELWQLLLRATPR